MQGRSALDELVKTDPRYSVDAYAFLMDALAYTVAQAGERRHVTGSELALGARDLALDCWGPMARHVLKAWGIGRTQDFGEIVFNLIGVGLLAKEETDKKTDFDNLYDFAEAFGTSYSPQFDEQGHIRRVTVPGDPPGWAPFLKDTGMN